MPYKKDGLALQLAKMRRNLKRRAATIERQIAAGKFSEKDIASARAVAENYRTAVNTLYVTRRVEGKREFKSEFEIRSALVFGKEILRGAIDLTSTQARQNFLTQQRLNNPETPLSEYTKEEVHTFYYLTESIWQGKDSINGELLNRNKIIMTALGIKSLSEAVSLILEVARDYILNPTKYEDDITVSSDESPELQGEEKPNARKDSASIVNNYVNFNRNRIIDIVKRYIVEQRKDIED